MSSPMGSAGGSHDASGTSAQAWRSHTSWSRLRATDDLSGIERLVVAAAHPDDESLGAAGLCARAAGLGIAIDVLLVTSGEHSHPASTTITSTDLAARRRTESAAALASVAPAARLHHLGVEDGAVAEAEAIVTARLVELIGEGRPALLVAPWRHDGHPDHEAVGRAAAAAARRTDAALWEYVVWFWHWADPASAPWADLRALTLEPGELRAKQAAIAAHASQIAPLSPLPGDETLLQAGFLAHFETAQEVYLVGADPGKVSGADEALDVLHRNDEEPWHVDERWYERRKRDLTLAALPRERFTRGLELGCSTGALASRLAERCDGLVAVDASHAAATRARQRLAGIEHVRVEVMQLPEEWPSGQFDLLVLSEVGYFLSPNALDGLRERVAGCLSDDGVVVLCHWRHPVHGWVLDGADVHDRLTQGLGLPVICRYVDRDVELLVLAPAEAAPDPER
ncbi:hypothetical protein BH09ACT12_BH09ACT12_26810 [soil metagenome]